MAKVNGPTASEPSLDTGESLAGSISTLDLLTAEQALISANAAVAASDAALAQDQIGLFKVLGGGWRSGGQ